MSKIPRWLELTAEIDHLYFILGKLIESVDNRTPFDKIIDEATGYDKAQFEKVKELVSEIKTLREEYDKL